MSAEPGRLPLAGFQQQAVDGLIGSIKRVAWHHADRPEKRREIGLKAGVSLLEAPTGSGKTLMLGRVLEGLRGDIVGKIIWFWFAPFSGLVSQTREALQAQCGSLRLRDVYADRIAANSRDGDVFVQTWDSMRANKAETRKVRQRTERSGSVEDMLADLREQGFHVGVVIDEAHLNFGASASASAKLYLDVLQADYTILATATPNDVKLEEFEKSAGIELASRVVIARGQAVDAGLNKVGLKLGYLRYREQDQKLIDPEQATLNVAWSQHGIVKQELKNNGIDITPLMLVQVEDQAKGGEDPVKRIREKLEQLGIPPSAIRSHTSAEPDAEFHTFAYDPDVEVLIFKVSVATGFDAPRAWTLVSVRPNRGKEFGLQIVGRIMRVHPSVRPLHKTNPVLDNGYVFLADPEIQTGLDEAVSELKAVRQGIELLTDRLDIYEFGNGESLSADAWRGSLPAPKPPASAEERRDRLELLVQLGFLDQKAADLPENEQDNVIVQAEALMDLGTTGLFGDLPEQQAPQKQASTAPKRGMKRYKLRRDLGIPVALVREELPDRLGIFDEMIPAIAAKFCGEGDELFRLLNKTGGKADLSLRELFTGTMGDGRKVDIRLSDARIADEAQKAFDFNDSIDTRTLKKALVARLSNLADEGGYQNVSEHDLRRVIDLSIMSNPSRIFEAIRHAHAQFMDTKEDLPIPEETDDWPDDLKSARLGAYGVFPERLNAEELSFAELLDEDDSGTVKWWLKNPENVKWATQIILPTGRRFFPDFAIGVRGRKNKDQIALVEIKDDGETGRLQSDINLLKAQVRHKDYGRVTWAFRDGRWVKGEFSPLVNRIVAQDRFNIDMLMLDS
jgi:type III restriction enzyme